MAVLEPVRYKVQAHRVEKLWFVGTNTLVAGQPLCYQEDPTVTVNGFPY